MEKEIEKIDTEYIDINSTDIDTLRSIVIQQRTTLENYEDKLKDQEAHYKKQIEEMNDYYTQKVRELTGLIAYHEKKLKIIASVAMLENSLKEASKNA